MTYLNNLRHDGIIMTLFQRPFSSFFIHFLSRFSNNEEEDYLLLKTLPFSLLFHALVIFSFSFAFSGETELKQDKHIQVTLVNFKSEKAPEDAKMIATVDMQQAGSAEKKSRSKSNSTIDAIQQTLDNNAKENIKQKSVVQHNKSDAALPSPASQEKPNIKEVAVMLETSIIETKSKIAKLKPMIKKKTADKNNQQTVKKAPTSPDNSVSDIMQQIAMIEAELGVDETNYNKRPTIRFVDSTSAKSAVEADYIAKWAKKVEYVGNQHFPEQAIREKLEGTLIVQVILDKEGKVVKMEVLSSSGLELLDQYTYKVLKLAKPYPPLPKEISKKWDQLSITRTWIIRGGRTTSL